jgi:hypothetical protein
MARRPNQEENMFRKHLALSLAINLLWLAALPSRVEARQEGAEAARAAKVKAAVAQRGTGEKARVTVELRDGRKVRGYVSGAGDNDFAITDPKTGQATTLGYGEVTRVSGRRMSKGAKIGLIVGIGAGVAALAFLLAVRESLDNFGRQ